MGSGELASQEHDDHTHKMQGAEQELAIRFTNEVTFTHTDPSLGGPIDGSRIIEHRRVRTTIGQTH
jgi:hypothetical protein